MSRRLITLSLPENIARWLQDRSRQNEVHGGTWHYNPDRYRWARIREELDKAL